MKPFYFQKPARFHNRLRNFYQLKMSKFRWNAHQLKRRLRYMRTP
jgi:hypothetical protein